MPADLKGLKIRTQNSDIVIDTINNWGGSATPMAFNEVYTSLQQGTVDGAFVNMATIHAVRWDEQAKYMIATEAGCSVQFLIVNNTWYESLPDEYKEMFTEACDWFVEEARKDIKAYIYGDYMDEMVAAGAEIYYPTEAEMEQWHAVKEPIIEKYADVFGGREYLNLVQAKIDAARAG